MESPTRSTPSALFTRRLRRGISIGAPPAVGTSLRIAVTSSLDEPSAWTYAMYLLSGLNTGKKLLSLTPVLWTMTCGVPHVPFEYGMIAIDPPSMSLLPTLVPNETTTLSPSADQSGWVA